MGVRNKIDHIKLKSWYFTDYSFRISINLPSIGKIGMRTNSSILNRMQQIQYFTRTWLVDVGEYGSLLILPIDYLYWLSQMIDEGGYCIYLIGTCNIKNIPKKFIIRLNNLSTIQNIYINRNSYFWEVYYVYTSWWHMITDITKIFSYQKITKC